MQAEVIIKTSKGMKRIYKDMATSADAETWIVAMAHNPNFLFGGCESFGMGIMDTEGWEWIIREGE